VLVAQDVADRVSGGLPAYFPAVSDSDLPADAYFFDDLIKFWEGWPESAGGD
jgi:hypothetical protein